MNGMIDDLRVYNLELSQAEVTAIFGNGHGDLGSPVTAPSLQVNPPADGEPVLFWGDLSKEENHVYGSPMSEPPGESPISSRTLRTDCRRLYLPMTTWPYRAKIVNYSII